MVQPLSRYSGVYGASPTMRGTISQLAPKVNCQLANMVSWQPERWFEATLSDLTAAAQPLG